MEGRKSSSGPRTRMAFDSTIAMGILAATSESCEVRQVVVGGTT